MEVHRPVNRGVGKEWLEEWGERPKPEPHKWGYHWYLNVKAEEEGLYSRLAEIIESPKNKCTPEKCYEKMVNTARFQPDELGQTCPVHRPMVTDCGVWV